MLLRITDGTTTVTLHSDGGSPSSGLFGARYFPRDPGAAETVTETAEVGFSGTTETVIATINSIEKLLNAAGQIDTYIEYSRNGLSIHRSPIVGGRVVWSDDRAKRQIYGAGDTVGEISVVWERANYWEANSDSTIGSFTVKNGIASPYNGVTLTTVNGNLPSPVKVKVYNGNGVEIDARNYYLSMDSFAGMTGTEHLFSSGAVSWAGAITHATLMWIMPLTSTFLTKNAGDDVQVVAAFSSLSMGIYMRASLYMVRDGLYVPIQHSGERYIVSKLVNLGSLSIPTVANSGLALVLSVYSPTAGSGTLAFAQLTPADGAVWLDLAGYGWKSAESVVEDGLYEHAYVESGSDLLNLVRRSGGPLYAWPGRTNRLFLLFDEGSGAYDGTRDATLIVTHRPRRSTV